MITLPIEIVPRPTPIVSIWSGSIEHLRGSYRRGEQVELSVTDCLRNAASVTWRSENLDGGHPIPRGSTSGCSSRWQLRDDGEHRWWVTYILRHPGPNGRLDRAGERTGPDYQWHVRSSRAKSAKASVLVAAVMGVAVMGVHYAVNRARDRDGVRGIGWSGAAGAGAGFALNFARLEW